MIFTSALFITLIIYHMILCYCIVSYYSTRDPYLKALFSILGYFEVLIVVDFLIRLFSLTETSFLIHLFMIMWILLGLVFLWFCYGILRRKLDFLFLLNGVVTLFCLMTILFKLDYITARSFAVTGNLFVYGTLFYHSFLFSSIIPIVSGLMLLRSAITNYSDMLQYLYLKKVYHGALVTFMLVFCTNIIIPFVFPDLFRLGIMFFLVFVSVVLVAHRTLRQYTLNWVLASEYLFNVVSDLVILYDESGYILNVNPSLMKVCSKKKRYVLGRSIKEVILIENHHYFKVIIKEKTTINVNGISFNVHFSQKPIKSGNKVLGYMMIIYF